MWLQTMYQHKPYRIEAELIRSTNRDHAIEASHIAARASAAAPFERRPFNRTALLDMPEQARQGSLPSEASQTSMEEIVAAIKELRTFIDPSYHQGKQIVEAYRRELAELYDLRAELEAMKSAIYSTKCEVATLHVTEQTGNGLRRASGELDAVVGDTENATTRILATTEEIETKAGFLRAAGLDPALTAIAESILSDVASLYEACNFQDLTGQRITKTVRTLDFVESRIDGMIAAWGGLEAFEAIVAAQAKISLPSNDDDPDGLINGPKLANDDGHVSQDDIDALFD
jgi:chemotaxis protein CheZ